MSAAHISDDHDPVCASEVIDIFEAQIGEGVVSENPLGKTSLCSSSIKLTLMDTESSVGIVEHAWIGPRKIGLWEDTDSFQRCLYDRDSQRFSPQRSFALPIAFRRGVATKCIFSVKFFLPLTVFTITKSCVCDRLGHSWIRSAWK